MTMLLVSGGCASPNPNGMSEGSMDLAIADVNRAEVFVNRKEYTAAIARLERAIQIEKFCSPAQYMLAWIYGTCPDAQFRDGKLAVEHALAAIAADRHFEEQGVDDKRSHWMSYAALAAAHAEMGQFDKAIEFQNKAIELVKYVPVEVRGIHARSFMEQRNIAARELYEAERPLRTYKLSLGRLSDEGVEAILEATDASEFPKLAD